MENKKYIESIGQAYQQVQEKLKGGQKKLDKDGDGDIDGTDFAMMRKKKKMDEDNHDKVECPKCKGEGCDHCDNKGYHMKEKTTQKEDEEIVMNPKKKKEKGEKATNQDSNMAQEAYGSHIIKAAKMYMNDSSCSYSQAAEKYGCSVSEVKKCTREMMNKNEETKWPIYQRIMEKNVVNQNAVPPQQMIPVEKQLKDHEGETVNQSQDHISAAAAQWIKDHDGNQVPDDAVDHEKVVAKNQQDLMRTVPNQAKDEVNKKAAKPETMKKVEEK